MTDATLTRAGASGRSTAQLRKSLKRRHARERRFKLYGVLAIAIAIGFLALLLGRIIEQGHTAFWTHTVQTEVYLDPARIDPAYPEGTNFDQLVAEQQLVRLGMQDDVAMTASRDMRQLMSAGVAFEMQRVVRENPDRIGERITVTLPIGADADLYYKGELDGEGEEQFRRLNDRQIFWLDQMREQGRIQGQFNTGLFTRSDSTQPELAGVLGAVVGSALMLLVTASLALPIGVGAAIYLEEFAPKGRITDIIEVNINNLAAVPSIVYGLLGLAVFINWMHLPRSSPLVGGLVLALMALPTVIIATRSALKAVPPSIREAALAMGASRTQAVFHHVLPLAMPGVMTGAIIAMAHALGETAPLLLIGMVSFVPGVPEAITSPSSALPVLVFIWENASERAFHERTAAAIMVLLVFMIIMNAAAIYLRRRFERRW
ncbi:phosphate ABC transporter permease PstA [Brevundimonas sp.]|uniref:phosphate ABC transporter permease PstA n=1 Tax=Brevundimonas sp. TaxID=1871086 RepID=UPI003919D492